MTKETEGNEILIYIGGKQKAKNILKLRKYELKSRLNTKLQTILKRQRCSI